MTYMEMCEYICSVFKKHCPQFDMTPEEVFNISPTGELYPVFDLWMRARTLDGWKYRIVIEPEEGRALGDIVWQEPQREAEKK